MHAEMVVDMKYNAPDKELFTVVSQTGPKWMINMVLKRLMETEQESINPTIITQASQITSENYNFTMLDPQDATDGCSYVLGVEPKNPNKFLFRGKIWVDDKDFAVCRIEAEPAKNPSFWIKSTEIHHVLRESGRFLVSRGKPVRLPRAPGWPGHSNDRVRRLPDSGSTRARDDHSEIRRQLKPAPW